MNGHVDRIKAQRQAERMVSLSDFAMILGATSAADKEWLGGELKALAAEYWLRHGGKPGTLYEGPQRVRQRSLDGSEMSDPQFSQAFLNDVITSGKFSPRDGILDSPFFRLPQEEQQAIIDGLVAIDPLLAAQKSTGQVEKLAIRAGLKDEVFR